MTTAAAVRLSKKIHDFILHHEQRVLLTPNQILQKTHVRAIHCFIESRRRSILMITIALLSEFSKGNGNHLLERLDESFRL